MINDIMLSLLSLACYIRQTNFITLELLFNRSRPLMLVSLALITTFLVYITKRLHNRASNDRKRNKLALPPGPKPWPFVGCLPQMLANKPAYQWIHNAMEEMKTEIACFRLGKIHVIPVTCPKIGVEFLKKQDAIFSSRPLTFASQVLSEGYLTTILVPPGPQLKKMKRFLAKEVLCPGRHRWLYQKRNEEADHLVHYVYNQCKNSESGGLVNVRVAARHYCGNVMRKIVFGKRFFGVGMKDGGPGIEEQEHVDAIFTMLEHLFSFCISDYLPFLAGHDLDGQEKMIKEANKTVNKYHDPVIKERVHQWRDGAKKEQEDLLDVFITSKDANGGNLLYEEIKAQIKELMLAGVDNPSNALEWALAEMINQPHILERATQELDKIVGKERLVQESDFPQLNYIKACAKEAFRLHPIAPFNAPHVSIADTTVSGYFIPEGSHVLLSRKGLGRNTKVWVDEPLMFKPERHLTLDESQVVLTDNDLNMISFSTGRRGCMGVNLGTTMTTMLFARVLQCFTWNAPLGESSQVDLSESERSLALAKPLVAIAKPRLPKSLYELSPSV